MQLHTFVLCIDVALRVEGISTPPFQTGGAGKPAPKTILRILYAVMIPYRKCLVNYAAGPSYAIVQLLPGKPGVV